MHLPPIDLRTLSYGIFLKITRQIITNFRSDSLLLSHPPHVLIDEIVTQQDLMMVLRGIGKS